MKRLLSAFVCLLFATPLYSQLLIWAPAFPNDNDNIVITLDASKGNQGLNNYSDPNNVYVHIGLITSASANPGDWKHSLFTWGTTTAAAKATSLGNNQYSFTINNIRTFFSVGASEIVYKIAILFRNGNGSAVQRNADASDMFVPVYDNSISVRFTSPTFQPKYVPEPEPLNKLLNDNIAVTAISNKAATLNLYLNGILIQTAASATTISANPVLTVAGNNTIIAEAIDGAIIKKDSLKFFVSGTNNIAPLPAGVKDGINYNSNNTEVTLVLYAPGKNRVSVIGEFPGNNWTEQPQYQMNKTPDGNYWWLTIAGLTPATEYAFQYLVDGSLKIGEPYAEKVLDPSNDGFIPVSHYPSLKPYPTGQSGTVSILQTAAPSYTWGITNFTRPDKRNLIAYEMLLRDFLTASNWNVLRDTLNYLKKMGINAIELMPVNEFDGNESWGYNPSYFLAPDKYYGPKNFFKQFIDSCHSKGIAVIMDIALNHATGSCPLAALYWNASSNQTAANNPWFNVEAKHPFNVFHDFNHESNATKYFFNRVVEHWLIEYKIDGFRFDLSKGFTQFNSGGNVNLWGQYDASRVAIWKRYYDTLQVKSPGSYAILEHFADNSEEKELSNYGMMFWGNSNYNFSEAAMGWLTNSNFENGLHSVRGWANPYLVTYMESHDEERLMYKNINFGNNTVAAHNTRDIDVALRRMEMSAAFLISMPGPKMIWQFGEQGYDYSINHCPDGTVNNNCRTDKKPVRWDYLQQLRRKRLYDSYTSLLKLRHHPWYKDVFIANNITMERSLGNGFKWLKLRSAADSSQLVIVGNFDVTGQTSQVAFPTAGSWYDYLNGNTFTATGSAQSITLQAGEFHIYLNRNLINAVTPPVIDTTSNVQTLSMLVYPNPVSSASVIDIEIPETASTQIALINICGQQMGNVFSGILTKGKHRLALAGKINYLAAGMYLLKVQSNNQTVLAKILIQ